MSEIHPFDDDFDLTDRVEIPISSSEDKETFLDYMKDDQGYTEVEVEELDDYMSENYGKYWDLQEDKVKTRWERIKLWWLKWIFGYKDDEYERYKKEVKDEQKETGLSRRKIRERRARDRHFARSQRMESRREAKKAAGGSGKKFTLTDKQRKALIIGAGVIAGVAVIYMITKNKRRR
jgi:hypothetical protein